ncbi:MAG: YggS family pyridoxal phosphate-dependent enzyme [Syntrophomonadaceae bacterium]|nr:YggS family pyridoxal phosphate-dependent enzyme [Syntrophomonadaceae bacterium]
MTEAREDIRQSLLQVQSRIKEAAVRSGRNENDIILVAVSKSVGEETIAEAVKYGIKNCGENRVQEFLPKQKRFPGINWHFIGHLQTNKVKDVIGRACLIHSLDRWRLAEYIDDRAARKGIEVPVLVQVNVAGESSKHGLAPAEVMPFMEAAQDLDHLRIKGLMTIAPETDNPEEIRPIFKELRQIFDTISRKNYNNIEMRYLSMGMTGDFEVAIEEGANIVRVGRAIFGSRG